MTEPTAAEKLRDELAKPDDPPGPGLYPDVAPDTYFGWMLASQSVLKQHLISPAHALAAITEDAESTKAQALGTAMHCAILEPERFRRDYFCAPTGDGRTKRFKEELAQLKRAHPGAEPLRAPDWEACIRVSRKMWRHETVRALLEGRGVNELSAVADLPYGFRMKMRVDRYTKYAGYPTIVDFKKVGRDVRPFAFSRDAAKYRYHFQARAYLYCLDQIDLNPDRRFLTVAFEDKPPFECVVYEYDIQSMNAAEVLFERACRSHANCVATGHWPGLSQIVTPLTLPDWALNEQEEP